MQRLRGEITVFLSLILVCVFSLMMGLLESARTAGARLYLQMAADSALFSVMSQYNRNLWVRYRLLFLEYEAEEDLLASFEQYLDFYLEQDQFYPARLEAAEITELVKAGDAGGAFLEQEILSYIQYRLPEVAGDLAGIAKEAEEAAKAGDFQTLLTVCRQTGERTKGLEKARMELEQSLEAMEHAREKTEKAAEEENMGAFQRYAEELEKEMKQFPDLLEEYESEMKRLSDYRKTEQENSAAEDAQASALLEQERTAVDQVTASAAEELERYRNAKQELLAGMEYLEEAINLAKSKEENDEDEDGGEEEADEEAAWEEIQSLVGAVQIPFTESSRKPDKEKMAALDRLEAFFQKDLLDYVIPADREISGRNVNLSGCPSDRFGGQDTGLSSPLDGLDGSLGENALSLAEQILVNEYVFLFFDSFLFQRKEGDPEWEQELLYEQEYILCGEAGDRDNLKEIAVKLLAVRGALNLFYLLGAQDKKAQADALAAAVSAGYAPVQFILSFFILTLWALGEAVLDVRELFSGGKTVFWKTDQEWRTELDSLLSLAFLDAEAGENETGKDYTDYLRILLFLQDRDQRNYRLMDVIQWNLRHKQEDFSILSCAGKLEIASRLRQKHLFLVQNEYEIEISAAGAY